MTEIKEEWCQQFLEDVDELEQEYQKNKHYNRLLEDCNEMIEEINLKIKRGFFKVL